jgi:hypothetical protein
MADNTIWVQALTHDRKVIASEYDEAHPTPNHEIYIVGYEDPRFDADGNAIEPANPPIEVGDTALIRQRIAEKVLAVVDGPGGRQGARSAQRQADLDAAEQERQAAVWAEQEQKAAKGAK